ncbi:MAG: molecular chaperone HtpG, partial [Candidatus Hydrogenedentes bacterium]|nr:molecular chaperone HtpG [Candidatus Hydrogenedentota bacterium]
KVLDSLKAMFDKDRDRYSAFWKEFGRILKEGIYLGGENKDQILGIALFDSTEGESKPTSLAEYVLRIKPEQDTIYYMTGESRTVVENSPHLEAFKEKEYEVLILTDPV